MILTPRLRLRALTTRDLALFRALYCDAETMRYIGKPFSRAQAAVSLRLTVAATRKPPRNLHHYVIVERKSWDSVGMCSLRPSAWDEHGAEAGFMLVADVRGRGYAREALQALIDAAFLQLCVDTVWVQHDPANASVARLSHALGFRPVRKKSLLEESRGQILQLLKRPRSYTPTTSEGRK